MSAITLYRKYRPQTFADIVSQDHIKLTIQQGIKSGKMPHAFLFYGPRGIGKTTTARILAKVLNCANRKKEQVEPCNECDSCKNITDGKSLSLVEVDAASQTGVDNVRDNIIANARVAVKSDEYKVFIIDEVHMLSTSSFNALLKTLEEPPEKVIFILATTEIHKIPQTIISRCQRFDFHPIDSSSLKDHLAKIAQQEKRKVDEDVLMTIAKKSAGHARDAVSLLGQILSLPGDITPETASLILPVTKVEDVLEFFQIIVNKEPGKALSFIDQLERKGNRMINFCQNLIEFSHQMLLMRVGSHPEIFDGEVSQETLKQIQTIANAYTAELLLKTIDVLMKRRLQLKDYEQGSLPLELAAIELINLDRGVISIGSQNTPPPTPPKQTPVVTQQADTKDISFDEPVQNVDLGFNKTKDVETSGDEQEGERLSKELAGFDEIQSSWNSIMRYLKDNHHSLFIALQTGRLMNSDERNVIAFKYKMHHDYVKSGMHKLVEACQNCLPEKTARFSLIVDESLPSPSGGDVEEPSEQEKESVGSDLRALAEAFGGSVIE